MTVLPSHNKNKHEKQRGSTRAVEPIFPQMERRVQQRKGSQHPIENGWRQKSRCRRQPGFHEVLPIPGPQLRKLAVPENDALASGARNLARSRSRCCSVPTPEVPHDAALREVEGQVKEHVPSVQLAGKLLSLTTKDAQDEKPTRVAWSTEKCNEILSKKQILTILTVC